MSQPRARVGRKRPSSGPGGRRTPAPPGAHGGKAAADRARAQPAAARKPPPEPPTSVRNAIRAMYAGAAVTVGSMIAAVASANSLRDALSHANPTLTGAQLRTLTGSAVTFEVIAGVVFLAAWVGMIWASRRGHSWVRAMAGVLLLFNTAVSGLNLRQGVATAGTLLSGLIWLIGLTAALLLWRKDSGQFFRTARTP